MNDVSIVTVTENAQGIIRDCLESARWADEIVVVDACSSDRTIEIASKYTNRIIKIDPALNSGRRWNRGIEAASKNWIFILESDKRIISDLKREITDLIRLAKLDRVDGYMAKTRNYVLRKWLKTRDIYPDYKLYLFKKGQVKFEERHNGGAVFYGQTGYLGGCVDHLLFRSTEQALAKLNKATDVLAEEYFNSKADFKYRYVLTKPLRLFKKIYFNQGANKEGMIGLIYCLILTFERFLLYVKLWAISQDSD